MVFGGGAPSFDWQRATETGEGVAQFRCSGNHCIWWQLESFADGPGRKTGSYRKTPPKCGMTLIVSVRFRGHDSCWHLVAFFRT